MDGACEGLIAGSLTISHPLLEDVDVFWYMCRVCPLMPTLRSTLVMPEDTDRLDKLSAALTALTTDPDADVAAAARAVAGEFQSKPVRRKHEVPPDADAAFVAFEAADKKKTAEESDMGMSADEIERYTYIVFPTLHKNMT